MSQNISLLTPYLRDTTKKVADIVRDIIIFLVVFVGLIYTFTRPHIGIYLWSWIGYMAPHRLAWGHAYTFPFAQLIALVTIIGLIFSKDPKRFPLTPVTVCLLVFIGWMGVTTVFAINFDSAMSLYIKVLKIQLVILITLLVINTKEKIYYMIWVIVLSLGFYGVKGGVFAIATGGNAHVLGPPDTFITGNTELGLALVMTLPLMYYLMGESKNKWIKRGFYAAMALTVVAVIATYSRGALLGVCAMGFFLFLKSDRKLLVATSVILAVPIALIFMPSQWLDRMKTIETYEEDASAMGRIKAWEFSYDMASQRLLGGGFESFVPENYMRFSPGLVQEGERFQAAHSNYFQVLGHHGFIGLFLYLLFLILTWRTGTWIIKNTRDKPELSWAKSLAPMIQISMVGYCVSGAFLGLSYFDLIYHLAAILVVTKVIVVKENQQIKNNTQMTDQHNQRYNG
ncbi:MAG: putative O-glycosylation ligase, exosortase A system-associated [Gammaproteobacteria bacterium]|nr:putative O-glycosylation ligase, exosortase A system-associated [Gammaproteobacteria bacterium]